MIPITLRSAATFAFGTLAFCAAPVRAQESSSAAARSGSSYGAVRAKLVTQAIAAAKAAVPDPHGLVILAGTGPDRLDLQLAHANVPDAALQPVLERARAELPAFGPVERRMIVFRLESAGADEKGVGAPEPPQVANWGQVQARVLRFAGEHRAELAGQVMTVEVEMVVAQEGDVAFARVDRSSGSATVDAGAVAIARTMRFRPARIGSRPVDVPVVLPLQFSGGS